MREGMERIPKREERKEKRGRRKWAGREKKKKRKKKRERERKREEERKKKKKRTKRGKDEDKIESSEKEGGMAEKGNRRWYFTKCPEYVCREWDIICYIEKDRTRFSSESNMLIISTL